MHEALNGVVVRLQAAARIDAAVLVAAAGEVQELAQARFDAGNQEWLADAARLQHEADLDELLVEVRRQVMQQLQATPACEPLQRFLCGPWALAMAETALRHGRASPELAALAQLVDQLIDATSRPGSPVPLARCAGLLQQVAAGLTQAGVEHKQAYAEVNKLLEVLRNPPPASPMTWSAPPAPDALPTGVGDDLHNDMHGQLPTVPMGAGGDTQAPDLGPQGWLSCLRAGVFCRLFLHGDWMTVQLSWISPTRNLYVFHRRHGKAPHSLTRRTLLRLRGAGMAASFEDGFVVARAMDTLAANTQL
jgi:hypothetical protein